jgi:hypothetical protein
VTRKALGAWSTPPALVAHVLDEVLEPVLDARAAPDGLRILDPACGDGRFLIAAAERIDRRFGRVPAGCLHGLDVDPGAVAVARTALGDRAEVGCLDALAGTVGSNFDAVVGNPPFLNQLAAATNRGGRSPWGGGPYADTAALFLAMAVRAARPDGGRVGLVLPHSVLSTRDTAPIRCAVLADARLDSLWWTGERVFDADVVTCVPTFVRGESQAQVRRFHGPRFDVVDVASGDELGDRPTWGHLVADLAGVPEVRIHGPGTLADLATATADFRDQYYGLVPHVADGADGPPLVTAGLIDVGRCAWGERATRFARRRFEAPRVGLDDLPPALRAWADRRLVPKVLVATQTPVIEAVVDGGGAWLPSVPVITVVPHAADDLWRVGAVLTAPAVSAWAAATYFGAALTAHAIKLSASQLLTLPVPPRPWDAAAAALARGDVDTCARLMDAAYGTDLHDWWRARQRPLALPPK